MRAVDVEGPFGRAEDGDAPVACMREQQEGADEPAEALTGTDRVSRHDCHSADDLVREERGFLVVEEIRLVPAQDEGRQRVDSPDRHQVACQTAVVYLERVPVAPRSKPRHEQETGGANREQQDGQRKPLTERAGKVPGAAGVDSRRRAARLAQCESERERLVGHHTVHPESDERIAEDDAAEQQRASCEAGMDVRIARRVEVAASGEQRHRDEARRDRAVTEAMLQMERDERKKQDDCYLPGTPLPACKTTRGQKESETERRDECLRDAVHVLGRERGHEYRPPIRDDRVDEPERPRGSDEPRQHERAPRSRQVVRAAAEGAREPRERRR